MLINLIISDFAIVDKVDISFENGFSVLTGETGAGKSILLDAISLIMGDKNNHKVVREGQEKAEITAVFNVSKNSLVNEFLLEKNFNTEEDECIVKRIIDKDGKSISYINGNRCNLKDLKTLGEFLITIHGQSEHQLLLKPKNQMKILNDFMNEDNIINNLNNVFKEWKNKKNELEEIQNNIEEASAKHQLLNYQLSELIELNLSENEFQEMESEHNKISNATNIMKNGELNNQIIKESEDFNLFSILYKIKKNIENMNTEDKQTSDMIELIEIIKENAEELFSQNNSYINSLNIDEEQLSILEERISRTIEISRKHKEKPENIYLLREKIENDIKELNYSDDIIEKIEKEIKQLKNEYIKIAELLRKKRKEYSIDLSTKVSKEIEKMNMPKNCFSINIVENELIEKNFTALGCDEIIFMLAPNIGQKTQPLNIIASGGELSRTSLAIQVTCNLNSIPTIIFDEVDSGISGQTANIVGKLLRKIGDNTQVFCITHLAQVASKGHNHYIVEKNVKNDNTISNVKRIKGIEVIEEVARLLGGEEITTEALENAKKLLEI